MFRQLGIKAVRMDDIAHNLGVSKRTLYELFEDKMNLLKLCMLHYYETRNSRINAKISECNNVLESILTAFDLLSEFIAVLSGSLIIEKMFAINGVGGLYLNSITFQDYDFFMLLSGFYTLVSLTAGIVTDISYGFIDPRIRMGAK